MDGMSVPRKSMTAKTIRSPKSGRKQMMSGRKQNKNLTRFSLVKFQALVKRYYRECGRHSLPWRQTRDTYRILVSEIMLQQTQVDRVIPKYNSFLKKFPTVKRLASASLASVLRVWQGLGYNRRAKYLHEVAKIIARSGGSVPRTFEALRALPGIGDYTARAIRTFAWSEPELLIETNIRTVFLHHFFSQAKSVADSQLVPYMELCLDTKNPREWYFALMDYGSHLKKTIGNASQRSAHHIRQKPFKGSDREIRGAILRALSKKSQSLKNLLELPFSKKRIQAQLQKLLREGLIALHASRYALHA